MLLKAVKIYILPVILVLLIGGCGKPGENKFANAHRMLAGLQTYTVTAEIIVRGNKLTESYFVKQYFKYPDRYRLEVLNQGEREGKTTVYDGEKIIIYQPLIKQLYIMENFKETEEGSMFPGYFAKSLFSSEEADYQIKKVGSSEYIAIKTEIPGGNIYRKYQILYLDIKSAMPVMMEVIDSHGDTAVMVHYKDFVYNAKIDDKLFTRESLPAAGVKIID